MKLDEVLQGAKVPIHQPLAAIGVSHENTTYWRANGNDFAHTGGDSWGEEGDIGSAIDSLQSASKHYDDMMIELLAFEKDPNTAYSEPWVVAVAQIKNDGTFKFIRYAPKKIVFDGLTALEIKQKFVEDEKRTKRLTSYFYYDVMH